MVGLEGSRWATEDDQNSPETKNPGVVEEPQQASRSDEDILGQVVEGERKNQAVTGNESPQTNQRQVQQPIMSGPSNESRPVGLAGSRWAPQLDEATQPVKTTKPAQKKPQIGRGKNRGRGKKQRVVAQPEGTSQAIQTSASSQAIQPDEAAKEDKEDSEGEIL